MQDLEIIGEALKERNNIRKGTSTGKHGTSPILSPQNTAKTDCKACLVYLDDVIIFAKAFEERLQNVVEIFL